MCKVKKGFGNNTLYTTVTDIVCAKPERRCRAVYLVHVSLVSDTNLGPVGQNIVSLTSSLRGQFVKCFTTL